MDKDPFSRDIFSSQLQDSKSDRVAAQVDLKVGLSIMFHLMSMNSMRVENCTNQAVESVSVTADGLLGAARALSRAASKRC